jgi:methyl-accepting chemotaxis protein
LRSTIKKLAGQTAQATQDIKAKIDDIYQSTGHTVTEIGEITTVIGTVNDTVGIIAAAVEEQAAVTREIANNTPMPPGVSRKSTRMCPKARP